MSIEKKKKLVKKLCILWITTFAVAGICSNIYMLHEIMNTGTMPIVMLSWYQLLVLAICLLYFYPLLFIIYHYAKQAMMKKVMLVLRVGIVFFSIWNTMAIIHTILAYIAT